MKEFRAFILRGNVIDLAVAVVIGAAFGAIVTSLVEDIMTPLLGLLGIPDFSTWTNGVGEAEIRVGVFLNALLSILLIAAAIFFLIVNPVQRLQEMRAAEEDVAEPEPVTGPSEMELLTQIRDELRSRST